MRLKIVSDGTNTGTKVIDADTGKELTNVTSVKWCMHADDILSVAVIYLFNVEVEISKTITAVEERKIT